MLAITNDVTTKISTSWDNFKSQIKNLFTSRSLTKQMSANDIKLQTNKLITLLIRHIHDTPISARNITAYQRMLLDEMVRNPLVRCLGNQWQIISVERKGEHYLIIPRDTHEQTLVDRIGVRAWRRLDGLDKDIKAVIVNMTFFGNEYLSIQNKCQYFNMGCADDAVSLFFNDAKALMQLLVNAKLGYDLLGGQHRIEGGWLYTAYPYSDSDVYTVVLKNGIINQLCRLERLPLKKELTIHVEH